MRETVPDRVLQEATDVVLVDITPDELIQRLNEGKVYVPETARRAIQNFFTPGNLTALRELALRRTADRVDDQMVDYLRQKAIEGPWAASERLLACVDADEVSERVVRRAAQLATSLNAAWTAVTIETVDQEPRRHDGEPDRQDLLARRAARRRHDAAAGQRLSRRNPAPRPPRECDPDRARPVARRGFWRRLFRRSLPERAHPSGGPDRGSRHLAARRRSRPRWRRFALKFSPEGLNAEILAALGVRSLRRRSSAKR